MSTQYPLVVSGADGTVFEAEHHLIAAAPEMLEALKEAQKNFKTYDRFKVDVDAMLKIEAAIAKAEGRP